MIASARPWPPARPVIDLAASTISWKRLWEIVRAELTRRGLSPGSISLHRHALRSFLRRRAVSRPSRVTESLVWSYLGDLTDTHSSASWIAANIWVLRTVFDKLGGMKLSRRLRTPKRPFRLPELLSPSQVLAVIDAAPTWRDRLLISLIYGCGLRVSEACRLRWQDVDPAAGILHLPAGRLSPARQLPLPDDVLPVLSEGIGCCAPADPVFAGARPGQALSIRMAQQIIRQAARDSGVERMVTAMTLRHSFAVHLLEMGASIRDLQERLGHRQVETTLIYEKCRLPGEVRPRTNPAWPPAKDPIIQTQGKAPANNPKGTETPRTPPSTDVDNIASTDPKPTLSPEPAPSTPRSPLPPGRTPPHLPAFRPHPLSFIRSMKSQIGNRFLALRRAIQSRLKRKPPDSG